MIHGKLSGIKAAYSVMTSPVFRYAIVCIVFTSNSLELIINFCAMESFTIWRAQVMPKINSPTIQKISFAVEVNTLHV